MDFLHLRRVATLQPTPAQFLAHFPDAIVQYLDDSHRRDLNLARSTPHFDEREARERQDRGCGVFFSPNAFSGRRRIERLLRIQAVYLDLDVAKERDNLPGEEIARRKTDALISLVASRLPPHAVVETKNGFQPIWKIEPLPPIMGSLAAFRAAMAVLLRFFGGDPGAKDPTRVLRLPGFRHLKDRSAPFRCRLVWNSLDEAPYELQSLVDAYYLPPEEPPAPVAVPHRPTLPNVDAVDVADVIREAADEAGVAVTFRRNADGSRQIVEDGEVTSGFVSSRGNFCYSASGKDRRGGPVQMVEYYLGVGRADALRWLERRFTGVAVGDAK